MQLDGGKQSLILGTPVYMAPEIVNRVAYGQGVDIWAIGVITLVLLTGKSPYNARTKSEILQKIKTEGPIIHQQHLDADSFNFINACLNSNMSDRPSASTLLHTSFITKNQKLEDH